MNRQPALALEQFELAAACGLGTLAVAGEMWTCAMLLGDFEHAWRLSDLELRRRRPRHGAQPLDLRHVWNGSPVDGKRVLVRCYHGLGDTIQFIRFARPLRARARRVIVQAERRLIPLLCSVAGIDALLTLDVEESAAAYDVEVESMELPHALRTTTATLPADVPYLFVNSKVTRAARRRMAETGALRVGMAWAGGEWWPDRSVPLAMLARLSEVPGVALYNLQRGPGTASLERMRAAPRFVADDGWCRDLAETAAMILNLDLVISVDTMVAHLAGALGVPVWLLLHFHADWRWMIDRDDTPWYPTMRLFRQPAPLDWATPVARIVEALQRDSSARRHSSRAGIAA